MQKEQFGDFDVLGSCSKVVETRPDLDHEDGLDVRPERQRAWCESPSIGLSLSLPPCGRKSPLA